METNINEIFELIKKPLKEKEKKIIIKAYNFAKKAHQGKKRASGDPYFIHSFETAKNLAGLGVEYKTIAAGLLHDILEDTKVSKKMLDEEFGEDIAFLVKGVTKLGKIRYQGSKRHVESLRKFFIAMTEDIRVLVIKLADRLHNIQTLKYLPEKKQKRIALETLEIHARLANRFGMSKLKGELEDNAFPYVYPKEYKIVEDLLKQKSHVSQKYLEKVKKSLMKELAKYEIKNIKTDYRIKHKFSLYQKLKSKDMDIDKIYDIVALRIIVPTIEDCYKVLGIIHGMWHPLPGRIRDFIANPKPNGYKSIHTDIFTGEGGIVEIQIRTYQMHEEAEYGIASHFIYKEPKTGGENKVTKEKMSWLNQFKELQAEIEEPNKFLANLKMDFFKDRIFVLTPKGDVIDLPEDSSSIDFAYTIHSDVGNHASSSKINGKFDSLYTKLQNGDMIEIIINKNSHPVSKWMEYTKTTLAQKHIRSYLKEHSLIQKFNPFRKK
ncbi:hypothetical protein A2995_01400 [Candidatus Nomurabacteria bacterium RIFCSPLOWO2_01_FULL_33_24]|uniref:TGS domain-containing protein n=1 Tax=Candidatus Nomurabacteria bacterium RIFCSPLOWO2_01_FULL_33_24 TaxID=1801765 RepID=A0A1F6X129_9BACT|nr:MAG: hypothetical protein A2995_01400 [Candidatus Nomurabacteria bacterium RIFCSPLOWO2_01_FULL_33_24]